MSLLQKLTVGKTPSPPRILLYGDAGVGKSSFAATAPKPVILVLEDGLDQIDCAKTPHIKDFATFIAYLKEIRDEAHDFQTVVIDSLSALQNIVADGVCAAAGAKFLTAAYGGYNRGNDAALVQFRKDVYSLLDEIRRKRNMCIIQIAHSHDETVKYTDGTTDRRTAPRLIAHRGDTRLGGRMERHRRLREDPHDGGRVRRQGRDRQERRRARALLRRRYAAARQEPVRHPVRPHAVHVGRTHLSHQVRERRKWWVVSSQ